MKNVEAQLPRGIVILLSITAILFIAALVWHSMVHPCVGATSDQALPLIQAQANS